MGGDDAQREPFVIDAEEFIGVKTFKAKGRRVTNWQVDTIVEIEPREPAPNDPDTPDNPDNPATPDTPDSPAPSKPDGISQDEVLDEFTGQQRIPFDEV